MQIEWLNSYLSTRFSALFHGLDKLIINCVDLRYIVNKLHIIIS